MPKRIMLTKIMADVKVVFVTDLKISIIIRSTPKAPAFIHIAGVRIPDFMAKLGLNPSFAVKTCKAILMCALQVLFCVSPLSV